MKLFESSGNLDTLDTTLNEALDEAVQKISAIAVLMGMQVEIDFLERPALGGEDENEDENEDEDPPQVVRDKDGNKWVCVG